MRKYLVFYFCWLAVVPLLGSADDEMRSEMRIEYVGLICTDDFVQCSSVSVPECRSMVEQSFDGCEEKHRFTTDFIESILDLSDADQERIIDVASQEFSACFVRTLETNSTISDISMSCLEASLEKSMDQRAERIRKSRGMPSGKANDDE